MLDNKRHLEADKKNGEVELNSKINELTMQINLL